MQSCMGRYGLYTCDLVLARCKSNLLAKRTKFFEIVGLNISLDSPKTILQGEREIFLLTNEDNVEAGVYFTLPTYLQMEL